MYRTTILSILSGTTLLLLAAACDFSPSAPFAGFDEDGATLNGRFQQTGVAAVTHQMAAAPSSRSASSSDALAATQVIVHAADGSEIGSVDIDTDGSFTLRGLPEAFTLVFVDAGGAPIGEPLSFNGVKPNQEIDLVVAMEEGSVYVVEEKRTGIDHEGASGIEIEGVAQNIVIETAPMTGSLDVNGHHVITRAAETSIRKGNRSLTLEDLANGDQVHVRGVFEGDDVFAFEIKLQEEDDDDRDTGATPACNIVDPEKSNHILICHKGKTLSVSPNAWPGHYGHGDTCGPC